MEIPKWYNVFNDKNQSQGGISMDSITQDTQYKQSVIKYSLKHGVTEAAIRYKEHRKTIYRWIARYDGTRQSLVNKSRRPHHHPREHTKEEKELVKRYKSQNKETGLVVFF